MRVANESRVLQRGGDDADGRTLHTDAQTLSGEALVKALRQGGYVLVMRHTSSPRDAPTRASANPDNVKLERQLDETGRATATAIPERRYRARARTGDTSTIHVSP
jgi:hypothetical protein